MTQIMIFTGKGGVGKSSIAAAHALKSAKSGAKTLLASTDMAHNLSDIFETKLGKEPLEVLTNLSIYEIDPNYIMEQEYSHMLDTITGMVPSMDEEENMQDFGMMPGMEELFSLLKISQLYKEETYDRIIVDCAPTGETLSLLKFPELLSWYVEKFFPLGRAAMRVLSPVSKSLFEVQLPDKAAMNDIERLFYKLQELQNMLRNRETTSIRLVTLPEKMVVEETKRNYMYMNLYDFNVDGLYINRVLSDEVTNEFFEEWKRIQTGYITELEENFALVPIQKVPWYNRELKGLEAITLISDEILDEEVFNIRVINERERYEKNEKGYLLTVAVPNTDKSKLEMYQSGTDVILKVNNVKRSIPVPNVIRNMSITSASMQDGKLYIQFE